MCLESFDVGPIDFWLQNIVHIKDTLFDVLKNSVEICSVT